MSTTSNKVKFGLKNCHYAKATLNPTTNAVTFATPVAIPGAVNLSLDPEGDTEPFYADDMVYYTTTANNGYSGDLEIALLPDSFRKDILAKYGDRLNSFFSCKEYIEIIPKTCGKGLALLRLAEILEIPVEDTIGVGDEANDLTMVEAAGLGVCMANGIPEVKAAADYITERDNNHDGVAEVIEKFVL